jgi:putative tryptophan/tyrosine transport system substrate-binding protein
LAVLNATTPDEIEIAFAALLNLRAGGLLVSPDTLFVLRGAEKVLALAARHSVPAIYAYNRSVPAGGLISYGSNNIDPSRLAGVYTGRVLKGESPADLPVQQPTKFDLMINLRTAKALGLTVPPALLAVADELIE